MRNFGLGCVGFAGGLMFLGAAAPADAATATRAPFGALPDGRHVDAVTLSNGHGIRVRIISFGAIIQSLSTPDRGGRSADIVLGYPTLAGYLTNPQYFGATVGRYANRIAAGRFTLDGRIYILSRNGEHSLHGGAVGFNKRLWAIAEVRSGQAASVTLTYTSPDGEEGYPGTVHAVATFALNERNELSIEYRATTDKPTIINMTGHSYFNLAGEASGRSVLGELLMIPAGSITPIDSSLIPTGDFRKVEGTPFDFRRPTEIGSRIRDGNDEQLLRAQGYDHNFVVARSRGDELRLDARVEDLSSGRVLEVFSNQPGVQFYSGNFLDGTIVGKSGRIYRQSDGLALEPELFPDTPNHPAFGSARLDPGQTYVNRILYRFSTRIRHNVMPDRLGTGPAKAAGTPSR